MTDAPQGFDAMKARLDEIVEEVSAEGISLDDALALYEEAVKLGLAACDVSEADILVSPDAPEGEQGEDAVAQEGDASQRSPEAVPQDASEGSFAGDDSPTAQLVEEAAE